MQQTEWELPEPPGVHPVRSLPVWRWLVAVALTAALVVAAFTVPIPMFYAYLPGPVRDVEKLVGVDGARTYSSEGTLYLTTVSVDTDVTFVEWFTSMFDNSRAIVDRESVTGGEPLDEMRRRQEAEMVASKRDAEAVALAAAGIASPTGNGVRIIETVSGAPAAGRLEPGDRIVAVDGERAQTTCDVGRLVDDHRAGDEVVVTVVRDGARRTMSLTTVAAPENSEQAFIGVIMRDINFSFDPPVVVAFDTGEIGGPSAGLMFALALYDRLTPDDLTGGRPIAGTGTITCDGGIGAIGGIEQKVAGAEREGAEIFLAPAANADAARAVAQDIEVVPVATFRDALRYLEGMDS